ncbi:hypothetical protein C8Q76DRAFT_798758 [Earliella scabrosa]|nr:hypothetical protein C8Q76DRAFT_798758 [Earliella scabrosa]
MIPMTTPQLQMAFDTDPDECSPMPSLSRSSMGGVSMLSHTTNYSSEVQTPFDSPYGSAADFASSTMGNMIEDITPRSTDTQDYEADDYATPRPPQTAFAVQELRESPVKARPLARVMGKAKGLVKALVHRKAVRKQQGQTTPMPESASTMAIATAIPGGWREALERPPISILIKTERDSDSDSFIRRMLSTTSTTGIYYPPSPPNSVASVFSTDGLSGTELDPAALPASHGGRPPLLPTLLRIALFLPWCALVGAAILLFPQHLERAVFSPGYLPGPSPRGLRRLAFWSDMAWDYVKIFLFALFAVCGASAGWGALLFALAAGRFAYVWMPFSPRLGTLHRRLGEDDMESLWLLVQDQTYLEEIVSCCAAEMAAEDLDERADETTPILPATPAD